MTQTDPTAEQIRQYERDGFLIVERWLTDDEVERTRERFHACFEHEWETGLAPDEVNYTPGVTPPDRTRQLCNVWKADRWLARITLQERNARFAAKLAGAPGMRLLQDNMIWKPPSGKALLAHQDAAYVPFLEPPNMTTCWMALDETAADTGTIYYARGSHAWGRLPTGDTFHAPEDWLGWMHEVRPPDVEAGRGRLPPRPHIPRLAAQRAARCGSAGDHQPHGHDGHEVASDRPAPALLALYAPRRARDGRGLLPDHVARGRLPHALHRKPLRDCCLRWLVTAGAALTWCRAAVERGAVSGGCCFCVPWVLA
jgi:hypothetical protein